MAIREVYIGSVGPFLYDDAEVYHGTIEPHRALYTPGRIRAGVVISDTAPSAPTEVVRLADLGAAGFLTPNIDDRTAARNIGTVYQNTTASWMIVMLSVDLEDSYTGITWIQAARTYVEISGGVITPTSSYCIVNPELGVWPDDLDTINPPTGGGAADFGKILILQCRGGRDVVVKHQTGNIHLHGSADFTLSAARDRLMLQYMNIGGGWGEGWVGLAPGSNNA